jgi:hypothetical protein
MNNADQNAVAAGAFALTETHKHWEHWCTIAPGLIALRKEAMASTKAEPGTPPYNKAFGTLLEEHGYGERALEKNTQACLLKLFMDKAALARLSALTKAWTPGELALLNPRKAWELAREQVKGKKTAGEEKPKEQKYTSNSKLEEMLGDAKDRLDRSVVLHIDVEDEEINAQVARLSADPDTEPRLRYLYGVLRRLYAEKGGLGLGNFEDAEIVE